MKKRRKSSIPQDRACFLQMVVGSWANEETIVVHLASTMSGAEQGWLPLQR